MLTMIGCVKTASVHNFDTFKKKQNKMIQVREYLEWLSKALIDR